MLIEGRLKSTLPPSSACTPIPQPTGGQATSQLPRTPTDATRAMPCFPRPQALDLTLRLLGTLEDRLEIDTEP